jgi:hypothetical protein
LLQSSFFLEEGVDFLLPIKSELFALVGRFWNLDSGHRLRELRAFIEIHLGPSFLTMEGAARASLTFSIFKKTCLTVRTPKEFGLIGTVSHYHYWRFLDL